MKWLITICLPVFLWGCEQRLTKAEWDKYYKPATIQEAKAKVELAAGEQKIKDDAALAKIERFCWVIAIVCTVVILALAYVKMNQLIFIPASVWLGSASGIVFLQFNSHYPKAIPLVGAGAILVIGGVAAFYFLHSGILKKAVVEIVGNVENIKSSFAIKPPNFDLLKQQSPSTQAIVAKVKGKL